MMSSSSASSVRFRRVAHLFLALLLATNQVDAFCPYNANHQGRAQRAPTLLIHGSIAPSADEKNDIKEKKETSTPRPLTQNWWPVTLSSALDPSRPNPIELLDQKLVLWCAGDDDITDWSCLDDACAHRFAPLSEGRVIDSDASSANKSNKCLQCAYHGWEFNGQGGCTRIPQQEQGQSPMPTVNSYPVRQEAGMVWVWADPQTANLAELIPLPISSLLQRFDRAGATASGFMRDLPYGMELLGENLVDISHLPFSHHSVGALNREDGRPVPLQMLSHAQREEVAHKQNTGAGAEVLPQFQAQVINADQHDPEVVAALKNPAVQAKANPDLAVSTVAFFDPCHVRYHRNPGVPKGSYEIQLFMCPMAAGKSRVFLFTPFESQLPPVETVSETKEEKEEKEQASIAKDQTKKKLAHVQKLLQLIRRVGTLVLGRPKKAPAFPPYLGHMIAHSIFDGDGIFLHKQGDRMRRSQLTYRDYNTPTSSDAMVNAFRRWLDKAASATHSARAVAAATGGATGYLDNRSRADMLDRYQTHTQYCKICLTALAELQGKSDKLKLATMALVGATGASAFLTVAAALLSVVPRLRPTLSVMLASAFATLGSIFSAKKALLARKKIDKEIQRFYFEDYIHAEKN